MNNIKNKVCMHKKTLIVLIISILLAFFVLYIPAPKSADTKNSFSAVRAQQYIKEISREPHSYYERDAHENVRQYLIDEIGKMIPTGNIKEMNYTVDQLKALNPSDKDLSDEVIYPIENILGVIKGSSDKGILLVAHYDSRGHVGRVGEQGRSYGAMDDGYGVATLLEIMNLLKDEELENSVYFLFTDAEEVGLFGAKLAAKDNTLMDNIYFVINAESRGRYGPSYMFETSKNNQKVLDLYKKAKFPVSYSVATAVYSVMPNFTDFTPFIDEGLPGINFATLAGLDNYHSPLDSYENINLSSIQHMGDQIYPIVKEFASNSKYVEDNYFKASSDNVFFLLFSGVLVQYSELFSIILAVIILIGALVLVFFKLKDESLNLKNLGFKTLKMLGFVFGSAIIGLIFGMLVAFLGQVPFNPTYVRVSGIDSFALLFIVLFSILFIYKLKNEKDDTFLIASIIFNSFMNLILSFTLSGATFLFMIPALLGLIFILINKIKHENVKYYVKSILFLINLLIIAPLMYSLYMALTVGGMVAVLLLLAFNLVVSAPILLNLFETGKLNQTN